jgi:hypothetical protein
MSNQKITRFNNIYNCLYVVRRSGTYDVILLEGAKENFHNKPSKADFKLDHMWHALCHQPKCCARHDDDEFMDGRKISYLNLDDDYRTTLQESVDAPCPISHDNARAQRKGKDPTTSNN